MATATPASGSGASSSTGAHGRCPARWVAQRVLDEGCTPSFTTAPILLLPLLATRLSASSLASTRSSTTLRRAPIGYKRWAPVQPDKKSSLRWRHWQMACLRSSRRPRRMKRIAKRSGRGTFILRLRWFSSAPGQASGCILTTLAGPRGCLQSFRSYSTIGSMHSRMRLR